MIFELTDKCWPFIMEGLDCLAKDYQRRAKEEREQSLIGESEEVQELIQTLRSIGQQGIGALIEGFRLKAKINGKLCRIEVRLAENPKS